MMCLHWDRQIVNPTSQPLLHIPSHHFAWHNNGTPNPTATNRLKKILLRRICLSTVRAMNFGYKLRSPFTSLSVFSAYCLSVIMAVHMHMHIVVPVLAFYLFIATGSDPASSGTRSKLLFLFLFRRVACLALTIFWFHVLQIKRRCRNLLSVG